MLEGRVGRVQGLKGSQFKGSTASSNEEISEFRVHTGCRVEVALRHAAGAPMWRWRAPAFVAKNPRP